jgi:hypothetical protein
LIGRHLLEALADDSTFERAVELLEHRIGPQVVDFAVGEGEGADPVGVERREYLAHAATGVVADQIDLCDVASVEESGEHLRLRLERDVLAGFDLAVTEAHQVGRDTSARGRQVVEGFAPLKSA